MIMKRLGYETAGTRPISLCSSATGTRSQRPQRRL